MLYDGFRFCVGDRYYLLGVRILCEADYENHLRQFGYQLQLCNGHLPTVSMATQLPPDNETMSDVSPWYQSGQQLVPGRRFQSSTENHKLFDDRSSGYGSPSPPCVWSIGKATAAELSASLRCNIAVMRRYIAMSSIYRVVIAHKIWEKRWPELRQNGMCKL